MMGFTHNTNTSGSPLVGELSRTCVTEGGIPHHKPYPPRMKSLARILRNNLTPAERKFWYTVNKGQTGFKFRRQYSIDPHHIVDFICLQKRLIVEIDGGQHSENTSDKERDEYFNRKGFTVIRFWNNDILNNIDGCYQSLIYALKQENPSPYPLPQGEGQEYAMAFHFTINPRAKPKDDGV